MANHEIITDKRCEVHNTCHITILPICSFRVVGFAGGSGCSSVVGVVALVDICSSAVGVVSLYGNSAGVGDVVLADGLHSVNT